MRVRIKFTKNDMVKFLGHLDIMRAFQRFFNCAEVKMEYSDGFNPHQKMHFALPLGVGITSRAEYLDAEIADGQDTKDICRRLNCVSSDAFDILAVRQLYDEAAKGMACVRYASYDITFINKRVPELKKYLEREEIIISKKTKTGIKEVDLKSILVKMDTDTDHLHILMKAGSADNLKPELIIEDMMNFYGYDYSRDMIQICRTELYADEFIPLIEYQTYS